jgi:hypothetical protein
METDAAASVSSSPEVVRPAASVASAPEVGAVWASVAGRSLASREPCAPDAAASPASAGSCSPDGVAGAAASSLERDSTGFFGRRENKAIVRA